MPRITPHAGPRILERFVLEASGGQPNGAAIFDKALSIGGDQMRHRAPFPKVAVQPEPAVHRVHHSFASRCEFTVWPVGERAVTIDRCAAHSCPAMLDQLQVMRPSRVEGAIAVAVPKYTVHFSAPIEMCVAEPDQPPDVASGTEIVTPVDERKLS